MTLEKVRPGSPEPLPINPGLIAVDLGGTLISSGQNRPGATRLLEELSGKGLQVILMSGEGKWFEKKLFKDNPDWRGLISQCLWDEDIHGLVGRMPWIEKQREWLEQMREIEQGVFNQIEKFISASDGGKYPPLWGIGVSIDDGALRFNRLILPRLGRYGFTVINPLSEFREGPEGWVDRVLGEVDQWRVTR